MHLTKGAPSKREHLGVKRVRFIVFAAVALRVLTRSAESYDATARLPLEDGLPAAGGPPAAQDESRNGGR